MATLVFLDSWTRCDGTIVNQWNLHIASVLSNFYIIVLMASIPDMWWNNCFLVSDCDALFKLGPKLFLVLAASANLGTIINVLWYLYEINSFFHLSPRKFDTLVFAVMIARRALLYHQFQCQLKPITPSLFLQSLDVYSQQ